MLTGGSGRSLIGVDDLRCGDGIERGAAVRFTLDGRTMTAFEGETISAALMAAGERTLRTTSRTGEPRGLFCSMGVCFDCLVQVDGRPNVRACQTPVQNGMRVSRQCGSGEWEPDA